MGEDWCWLVQEFKLNCFDFEFCVCVQLCVRNWYFFICLLMIINMFDVDFDFVIWKVEVLLFCQRIEVEIDNFVKIGDVLVMIQLQNIKLVKGV